MKLAKALLILAGLVLLLVLLASCGKTYTVAFDSCGGNEIESQQVKKGKTAVAPAAPEREGYTFIGWRHQDEVWSFDRAVDRDITLMAQWEISNYAITYVLGDGVNEQSNPDTFTIDQDVTLAAPCRAGYNFIGWTWEGQAEPQMTVIIPTGTHENKAFTANWQINCLIVSDTGIVTGLSDAGKTVGTIEIPATYNGIAITSIGDRAFYMRSNIKNINIGSGATNIGEYAFFGCTNLSSVAVPDQVTNIGRYAFGDCSKLKNIIIGSGVTSIGERAFVGCASLSNIAVSSNNAIYCSTGNCLIETDSKMLVVGCKNSVIPIDGSVTNISENAFFGCEGLLKIVLPDSMTSIHEQAFSNCTGLTDITITNRVTSIGNKAFAYCTRLTNITFEGTQAQWNVISKGTNWDNNTGNYTVHCTDGDIAKANS